MPPQYLFAPYLCSMQISWALYQKIALRLQPLRCNQDKFFSNRFVADCKNVPILI